MATSSSTLARGTSGRTSADLPASSTPCIKKAFFARSILTVTIFMISLSQQVDEKIHLAIVALSFRKPQPLRRAACLRRGSPFHSLDRTRSPSYNWRRMKTVEFSRCCICKQVASVSALEPEAVALGLVCVDKNACKDRAARSQQRGMMDKVGRSHTVNGERS